KPLDGKTIRASTHKTGAVLTVENHNIIGGLHSAVLELLARDRIPVSAVGVRDRFGEVGKAPHLKEVLGLRAQDIAAMAREAIQLN
ncbi:MAG: transketolase family protein, partial [Clostridiales bacterium]|nr:transketolase family protein [Clostridiales bacterium]